MESVVKLTTHLGQHVDFPVFTEPTLEHIANLCISSYVMIQTALFVDTALCKDARSTIDELFSVYERLRSKYNPKIAVVTRDDCAAIVYDMWRNGDAEIEWRVFNEPKFRISESRKELMIAPCLRGMTVQEMVDFCVQISEKLKVPNAEITGSCFIIHRCILGDMKLSANPYFPEDDEPPAKKTRKETDEE